MHQRIRTVYSACRSQTAGADPASAAPSARWPCPSPSSPRAPKDFPRTACPSPQDTPWHPRTAAASAGTGLLQTSGALFLRYIREEPQLVLPAPPEPSQQPELLVYGISVRCDDAPVPAHVLVQDPSAPSVCMYHEHAHRRQHGPRPSQPACQVDPRLVYADCLGFLPSWRCPLQAPWHQRRVPGC